MMMTGHTDDFSFSFVMVTGLRIMTWMEEGRRLEHTRAIRLDEGM